MLCAGSIKERGEDDAFHFLVLKLSCRCLSLFLNSFEKRNALSVLGECHILKPEAPLIAGSAPWMAKGHIYIYIYIAKTACCPL